MRRNTMMPKIAAIQMCSTSNVDENLLVAERLIKEAAKEDAQVAVLPEMFAIFGNNEKDKLKIQEIFGNGRIQNFLSQMAHQHKIWIVGGTIPITCPHPNKVRAACIVMNDEGNAVTRYDKIHLFNATISETERYMESDTIEEGNTVTVIDSPVGKLGLAVCYDIRFPELFRLLRDKGAEILVIPSAFTITTGQAHWKILTQCSAIENNCYVVGAAQGGTHTKGRKTYGHSIIVDAWGNVLKEKINNTPGIIVSDVNLKKLHEIRRLLPTSQH